MNKFLAVTFILCAAPGWAALKRTETRSAPSAPASSEPAGAGSAPSVSPAPAPAPSAPATAAPAETTRRGGVVRRRSTAAPSAAPAPATRGLKRVPSRAGSTPPPSSGGGSGHWNHGDYPHHYYHGSHWYRFPYHDDYFYARLYGDRWWWYDSGYSRWVYWSNGYWLYPSPNGMTYVYVDNIYRPYGYAEPVQPPETAPEYEPEPRAARAADRTMSSPDGKRQVQLIGERSQAFLYERQGGSWSFVKYLAENVRDARYSGGINNQPLRILLDFEDGTFALYDDRGEPVAVAQTGKTAAPALPPAPAAPPAPR